MTGAFQVLSLGMPFEEAIAYFRQKVNLPTETWMDIWEGMHARAFVVAGAMKDALLVDLRSAVDKAISQGTGLDEFRRDFDELVARNGWSYRGGRNWRSRVIFETNLRTAYQAGHWKAMTDPRVKERRPFMRYVAVLDSRTRPLHRAWHNTVLPKDDPWWNTHYPPNGWGCRCTTVDHDAEEIEELRKEGEHLTTSAPPMNMREVDGLPVPEGIDPGWAYNVGTAAWGETLQESVMREWEAQGAAAWEPYVSMTWKDFGRSASIPLDRTDTRPGAPAGNRDDMIAALKASLGGDEKIFSVGGPGSKVPVVVNADVLGRHLDPERARFLPFLPEVLEDPFEVWAAFDRHKGTGEIRLRTRVIKAVRIGRGMGLLFVAQASKGALEGWTYIPMRNLKYLQNQRYGRMLYGRAG